MNHPADTAIIVRNLSKKYRLSDVDEEQTEKKELRFFSATHEFYALKEVSFDLMAGEVVGIIGNNGSGKTTLLRVLSEITKPSKGEAIINGSVTSILDIGSNFHPDLTGRENTQMQLRVRGIAMADFPELLNTIKDYSEIGDFFDQPVKYYSNGMFLRLAFSVAFNMPADILILDEVLSVGDEAFRLKSQSLIKQLKFSGKTILLVSHSRNEILDLCDRCIWLEKGEVKMVGTSADVLGAYFEKQRGRFETGKESAIGADEKIQHDGIELIWNAGDAPGNELFSLLKLRVSSKNSTAHLFTSEEINFNIQILKKKPGASITPLILLHDIFNQPALIAHLLNNITGENFIGAYAPETGLFEISCTIPANFLAAGWYYVTLNFGIDVKVGATNSPYDFHLVDDEHFKTRTKTLKFRLRSDPKHFDFIGNSMNGPVRPSLKWSYLKQE